MHGAALPRGLITVAAVLVAGLAIAGAQPAPVTPIPDGPTQQSQSAVSIDLPSARGTELIRHVTEANFRITARQDTATAMLPQERNTRYMVTMQGDMLFRNAGHQVRTDARVLERHPSEIRFTVDITSPDGPAAQMITPRTVQEQVTVDPGTYDATVIVTVDGRAVYREQRRLQIGTARPQGQQFQEQERSLQEERRPGPESGPGQQQQLQQRQPRERGLQEQERSLQEQGQRGQAQQATGIERRIQQLEQRIAMLEQELRRLRPGSTGTGANPQQPQQRSPQAPATPGQQPQQPATADPAQQQDTPRQQQSAQVQDTAVDGSHGGATVEIRSAQNTSQNRSIAIGGQQPVRGEEEAALEERGQRQQDRGPIRILISIFT